MTVRGYFHDHRFQRRGGFVIAVLILIIISFCLFFPATILGAFIGDEASRRLSRELTIEGPVDIAWHWTTPRIHAEKIRLANMPGSDEPDMLTIEEAEISIRIWKLLIGRTELPEVTLSRPRLVLEKRGPDEKNWEFPALSGGEKAADAALPDDRHDFPMIGRLLIREGAFIYRDAEKDLNLDLKLETAQAQGNGGEGAFRIEGKGTLQQKAFDLKARGGSLEMLRDSRKDYPLDLAIVMGATKVGVKGTFRDPIRLTGMDVALDLSGDNMADLFYLTGIPLPPTPAYTLTGALGKDGDVWTFNGFKGKVGDSDLSGDVSYDLSAEKGFFRGNLVSHVMDMKDLGGFIGLKPNQAQHERPRVLPDVPINLSRLRSTNMDVTLAADTIRSPGLPFRGGNVRFDLQDGLLKLDPLRLTLADGTVAGNIVMDGRKDIPDVALDLDVRKLSLKRFFDGTRFAELSDGRFGGKINLTGQGKTLADVLGASDGRTVFLMSGGRISLLLVEAADIDISEAAPLLLGDDRATRIRCGVADFKVTDGLLRSEAIVLDTDDTNLQGKAVIDLRSETIDATLDANSKDKSILAGQVPVKITGTLKDPAIGVEPIEAGARGAAAVALGVVLTPLASIIPFIEPGLGEDTDCGALIATAKANAAAAEKETPKTE